ncbi:MAG: hypothetical protein K1X89_01600 [Myxococcaceae bacterium]|nr:hypothetical protein [Myxococcaceae bacterium]
MNASSRALLVGALALAACTKTPPADPGPSVSVDNQGPVLPIDHPPIGGSGGGTGSGGGSGGSGGSGGAGGGGATGPASSLGQRLTVAQLKASLPVILGTDATGADITWKIGAANGFDTRAQALGVPDYIATVDENLEASPLYVKFMNDMARDACGRALTAEAAKAQTDRPVRRFVTTTDTVASNKAAVDANLRFLKLSFHGVKVAPGDDAPIASLRALLDDVAKGVATPPTAAAMTEGWRAVCVALLTAPEYHLY